MDRRLGAPGAAPYQCAACSQAAAAWPAPMGRTARLRARAQACARSRIARLRATAEDPGLTLPHWHTPPPLHRTAGARREGGRVRVAVVDSATPPGRSPAVAAAQVAVEYGARRRAEQAPSPPCGSAAADSPAGQVACRSCAAPSCGQCGTSTSYVYLERRGGESARARVGNTAARPRCTGTRRAYHISAFQVQHVLARSAVAAGVF